MITLTTELGRIRGLNPSYVLKLRKLDLKTVRDLLWHFPSRYDDFSNIIPIANLEARQTATISGVIKRVDLKKTWKRHMVIVEAVLQDTSGSIKAIWFNQPYIARILRSGMRASFAGKVSVSDGNVYLSNPSYEPMRAGLTPTHTGGLVPIYPETRGLTSRGLRYLIKPILQVLPAISDPIPEETLRRFNLPSSMKALQWIHFPKTLAEAEAAKKRFAFEDLFFIHLRNLSLRARLAKEKAPVIELRREEREALLGALPFELTASQEQSLDEIFSDFAQGQPMNRLLQGDVGSGKTAVAALAAFAAHARGMQSVFMAPTEVLARQHYATLISLAKKIPASIGLLVGSEARIHHADGLESKTTRPHLKEQLTEGKLHILIGTHALIEKPLLFQTLAFVVIDEQHRFGVLQRATLLGKNTRGLLPHFLSMSATPIPRTLSLTVFGDLDLSIINELPKGRKPIITKVVVPENREKAYAFVREEIKRGRQVFVICPRIAASENGGEPRPEGAGTPLNQHTLWSEVKAVTDEYEKLSKKVFLDFSVRMLHGKMKSAEKTEAMHALKNKTCDVLVATSVIEVGIDIPNASIMLIEGAERFGLAQLYQFRGRVGRGEHQSYCLLFTSTGGEAGRERLAALLKAKNGFDLAELDLKLRGPGEFLGKKQTGLPDVAMQALTDIELVKKARDAATAVLSADPDLVRHPILKERLAAFENIVHLE
jgi:ATP-dependent DNA helicase RecG